MAAAKTGNGADERDTGSWANETLPMTVRRELLERELARLGFGKAGGGAHHGAVGHPQQQQAPGEHPQADAPAAGEHPE